MKTRVVNLLLSVLRFIANLLQKILSFIYKKIFDFEWGYFSPEFFDHKIDLFYQWPKSQDPYPLKRGVLSNFWIEKFTDAKVMELCCGDGFNTYNFYCSKNVNSVISCDYLQSSIDFAKKNYTNEKINFVKHDLYDGLPSEDNDFTNVVWDAAINYFPEEELNKLFTEIKNSLSVKKGIFSGTVQYNEKGSLWEHYKTNFSSEEEFLGILKKYFNSVSTRKELRGNEYTVYFAATNGDLL